MTFNPTTAKPAEQWGFRMEQLECFLKEIPFTTTQRLLIEHHLHELGTVFHTLRIVAEDAGIKTSKDSL